MIEPNVSKGLIDDINFKLMVVMCIHYYVYSFVNISSLSHLTRNFLIEMVPSKQNRDVFIIILSGTSCQVE